MGKKGKGSKKNDEKKKKKKKKKDDTHTSIESSVTVPDQPTAVPMKKFMVLYMASGPEFERMRQNSTPEQRKKGMDAWMKWINANKTSMVEGGAPLGKTKRLTRTEPQTQEMRSEAIRLCSPNRMMQPRRYSAKTILICKCPAHGSKSSRSCRCLGCSPAS